MFLHFNYTGVMEPPYWIFSQCSVHDAFAANFCKIHTKFWKRIAKTNYLRETLPLAVENV